MVSSISSSSSSVNAAALKKMQEEMFKAVDSNNDNKIDKAEMSAYQQTQQANGQQGGPSVDDIFSRQDTNSDGAISRLESDAGIAKLAGGSKESAAPAASSFTPDPSWTDTAWASATPSASSSAVSPSRSAPRTESPSPSALASPTRSTCARSRSSPTPPSSAARWWR